MKCTKKPAVFDDQIITIAPRSYTKKVRDDLIEKVVSHGGCPVENVNPKVPALHHFVNPNIINRHLIKLTIQINSLSWATPGRLRGVLQQREGRLGGARGSLAPQDPPRHVRALAFSPLWPQRLAHPSTSRATHTGMTG
jgi:hypothetical protein